MKREDIKKLGIEEDEVLDKIMAMHGKGIEKFKTDLETAQTQANDLKTQLDEANTTIEGFKEMDIEAIKASADEWKAKAATEKETAEKRLSELQFDHALDGALVGAKAKSPKAVKALLKIDDLKLTDDGKLLGLDDQIAELKQESDYLFETDEPEPKIVTGGKNKNVLSDASVVAARQAAGLPVETE